MTWEIFATVLTALAAFIGTVWGIIKFYQNRKDEQDKANKTFMEEKLAQPITQMSEQLAVVEQRLANVEEENKRQAAQINENEKYRIRQEIIMFSRDLRDGRLANISDEDFKHIHAIYDRYTKELGGNSYIVGVMKYIKEQEQQYLNSTKGEDHN